MLVKARQACAGCQRKLLQRLIAKRADVNARTINDIDGHFWKAYTGRASEGRRIDLRWMQHGQNLPLNGRTLQRVLAIANPSAEQDMGSSFSLVRHHGCKVQRGGLAEVILGNQT
jgi:hypothetical protein